MVVYDGDRTFVLGGKTESILALDVFRSYEGTTGS